MKTKVVVLSLLAFVIAACGAQPTPIVIVITAQPQVVTATPESTALPVPSLDDFCTCATSPTTMRWLEGSMAFADEIIAILDEYTLAPAEWPSAQEVDARIEAAISALPAYTPCVEDIDNVQIMAASAIVAFAEAVDQGDIAGAEIAQRIFLDSQDTIMGLIQDLMNRCGLDGNTSY